MKTSATDDHNFRSKVLFHVFGILIFYILIGNGIAVKDVNAASDNGDYNLYFGQLHSHTTNSDGTGSPDEAFNYAKNIAKVDFLAVTDHSNSFDNAAASSMADGSKSTKWVSGHAAADNYTDSSFVGIYAYEMTWSNGTGHINTFNTSGFETRDTQIYKNADGLQQYYNVLKQYPASISQFNHPGTTFGDFNDFAGYDSVIDQQITLIEVGNGEGAIRSNGYFPSYDYYTRALDKGWHLAPTNNQDNHLGLWGNANTARTVILASSLSRENIYDAMKNRHCYATEDNNLRIKYTLNGMIMGSILPQKPDQVDIQVNLEDPDNEALGKVSIIANGGRVVATKELVTNKDSVEFTLAPDYSYYYIRVDEGDKDIAVTAPVWICEVDKAGISKTTSNTTLPLKDQKFKITTNLFNNENYPMILKSLEFSINGSTIHTASALSPVASLSTGSYSFEYTPIQAGKYNIDVKLTADINGITKTFTDVLKLNVADPAITTKVIVDASHYNDYVAGYYAGNMTNLVTLANNENINVVIQNTSLTDAVLQDAQLLILSPPAKKNGTASGATYSSTPYTDEDIAVIKRFADRGGNIIVTALADYQDNRSDSSNHSAYQQNRILAAIGAGSRFNDDEVVDYENNPNANNTKAGGTYGTPYRAPMHTYNWNSLYLDDVQTSQNYSFYSGCSFTLGENGTWLVKGTATTYGFDSDNDRLGGSYSSNAAGTIPADTGIGKGNVIGLATETLPGGGKLFIGGTVFYSNFEIKVQLDNYDQLQNSNYNITMNILESVKKIIPVTPINQVRLAQLGETYCIEGIVTAGTTPGNAFFDTIYIQDLTGGMDIYPVSGMDIKVGQKVKVTGTVDEYQGDRELRVIDISLTDPAVSPVLPLNMSTIDSMSEQNEGWLVKVGGTVTKITGNNLYLNDGSGEARVFLDGYIGDGTSNQDALGKWDSKIAIGDTISAIGLASQDGEGHRIRVRNSAEIVLLASTLPVITGMTTTLPNSNGWFNHDVTVHFEVDDPFQLLEYFTPDVTLSSEGVNQSVTGIARNVAGKIGSCTVNNINIDKTIPLITSLTATSCRLGDNLKLEFSTQDNISGVASSQVVLNGLQYANGTVVKLTKAGINTLEFIAYDKAGNMAKVSQTVNVVVPVEVRIRPEILNLKGCSYYWTVLMTIRIPENVSYTMIQLDSIRINGVAVPVKSRNLEFLKRISRHHANGEIEAILMKLDKDDLKVILQKGLSKLTITGSTDIFEFAGECQVRVIK